MSCFRSLTLSTALASKEALSICRDNENGRGSVIRNNSNGNLNS